MCRCAGMARGGGVEGELRVKGVTATGVTAKGVASIGPTVTSVMTAGGNSNKNRLNPLQPAAPI